MSIEVYEHQTTGEAVITLGERFDITIKREFAQAYSSFKSYKNYLIDLTYVKVIGSSAFEMLTLLREYSGGINSKITITGYNHEFIREALKDPRYKGLFKLI
jgi:HptB-dependent secretion and biofilm anti anti-sigma factor